MTRRSFQWEVFHGDGKPAVHVVASGPLAAIEAAREVLHNYDINVTFYPHRTGCSCRNITRPCVLHTIESRLKGTGLGKIARL